MDNRAFVKVVSPSLAVVGWKGIYVEVLKLSLSSMGRRGEACGGTWW